MSVSERVFWTYIRGEKLGFKFRRQQNVGKYHLDFYCAAAKVGIEIDGEQHESQRAYDEQRDAEMKALEILTFRFPSLSIFDSSPELDRFLELVYATCCERTGKRPPRWFE